MVRAVGAGEVVRPLVRVTVEVAAVEHRGTCVHSPHPLWELPKSLPSALVELLLREVQVLTGLMVLPGATAPLVHG